MAEGITQMCQKSGYVFLSFIKSSLLACRTFQDTGSMPTQCTIAYYSIYLHTDDMQSREEAEEKKRKHIIGEISIFDSEIEHTGGMR